MADHSSPFADLSFPTDRVFRNTNISKIPKDYYAHADSDGGDDDDGDSNPGTEESSEWFFFTIPMSHLVPCPSSLHEMKCSQTSINSITTLFSLFVCILGMLERDLYSGPQGAPPSRPRRGGRRNGGDDDDDGLSAEAAAEGGGGGGGGSQPPPRYRIFMEYLVSENMVSMDDTFDDINLIDVVAIRFCFVLYGSADLHRAFVRMITHRHSDAGRAEMKRYHKENKGIPIPPVLLSGDAIDSWAQYAVRARSYLGTNDTCTLRDPRRNSIPDCMSPIYAPQLFSRETSIEVAERSMGGVRIHPRQRDTDIFDPTFGIKGLVYEVLPQWANRTSLLYCILPRSVKWRHLPPAAQGDVSTTLELLADMQAPNVRAMFRAMVQVQEKKNDLKDLGMLVEKRLSALDNIEEPRRARLKAGLRKDAMRQHERIWNTNANISAVNKQAVLWAASQESWTSPETHRRMMDERNLSSFGNMVAMDMYALEFSMAIATTHNIFYLALICSFNAYYYKLGTLHCNLMLLGAGASGKSFILNSIDSLLIGHSTETVSNQTEKALATGEDSNDHITLFHELPGRLLASDGASGGNETGDTLLKDVLTRGTVSTTSIVITDDHQRKKVRYEAEHVGVVICATNEREDRMHESLKSRFICVPVNEKQRKGAEVIDKQKRSLYVQGRYGSDEKRLLKEQFKHRVRVRQVMVIMVERLISTKVFDEPNMAIADLGINAAVKFINEKYVKGEVFNNREVSNIILYARTLTIMHACERYANDATSPGFGKAIEFSNLRRIQEYLVCTEEIAVYALSAFFHNLIRFNTMQTMLVILRAVVGHLQVNPESGQPMTMDDVYFYTTPNFRNRSRMYQKLLSAQKGSDMGTKLSLENIQVAFNQLTKMNAPQNGRNVVIHDDDEGILKLNREYIEEHFHIDMATGKYKMNVDVLGLFRTVVKEAFSHRFQGLTKNAITAFPLDESVPFVMSTIDLGVNKERSRVITDVDHEYDIAALGADETPTVKHMYGDKVLLHEGTMQIRCDLQDLVYTENLRKQGLLGEGGEEDEEEDPNDRQLLDSTEALAKVNPAPHTKDILANAPKCYPEGLKDLYTRAFCDRPLKRVRFDDGELNQ